MSENVSHNIKLHTPRFLQEVFLNLKNEGVLKVPVNVMRLFLLEISERCTEVNDPILNDLMIRMALYSVGDPDSEDFDQQLCDEIHLRAEKLRKELKK